MQLGRKVLVGLSRLRSGDAWPVHLRSQLERRIFLCGPGRAGAHVAQGWERDAVLQLHLAQLLPRVLSEPEHALSHPGLAGTRLQRRINR